MTEFNVGDRVRVSNYDYTGFEHQPRWYDGLTGTVIGVTSDLPWPVQIRLDNVLIYPDRYASADTLVLNHDELEHYNG